MPEEQTPKQIAIGNYIAQAIEGTAIVAVYQDVSPRQMTQAELDAAQQKLDELPLDDLPPLGPLPTGSRMPFAHNPLFVDRETELRKIASILKEGVTPVAVLAGLGGIGKTQLASEFVHRYGKYFSGGIFWLSFAEVDTLPAQVAACHIAMRSELPLDITTLPLDIQVQLVLTAWQSPLPRLLVFDTCEKEEVFNEWRPHTGGSRVIVTSRRTQWDSELGVNMVPLHELPREESLALLQKHRSDLSADELDAIAKELGDLPLALHLAGSFLSEYRDHRLGMPTVYLEQLRQVTPLQHPSLRSEGISYATGHERDVERTFALSYKHLDSANTTDRNALRLLARAAYFAFGEPIPQALLVATLMSPEKENDEEMEYLMEMAFKRLSALGLLEFQAHGMWRLHRLLAVFVRREVSSTDPEAQMAVERVLLAAAQILIQSGYPAPTFMLQPHLRAMIDLALPRADEQAAELCNALGHHLYLIGAYHEAETYFNQAQHILEQLPGDQSTALSSVLGGLAATYIKQGKYEPAESLLQRNIQIDEQVLGPQHSDVATSLNNLATLYERQGKFEQAEPLLQRALQIYEQTVGPTHPNLAGCLVNLGQLYKRQGKFEQAEPLLERALQIYEQVLEPTHPDLASILNNLAGLYEEQGKYEQAEPLLQRALQIREQALGAQHSEVSDILDSLANLYNMQGKFEQAEQLYRRALQISEQALGPTNTDVANSLNNLATVYAKQGKFQEVEPLLQRALQIYEQVLGPSSRGMADSLHNLANLYTEQGKFEQAEQF